MSLLVFVMDSPRRISSIETLLGRDHGRSVKAVRSSWRNSVLDIVCVRGEWKLNSIS
jgi:hypothetical protein